MGIFECDEHGRTGIVSVCKHINAALQSGEYLLMKQVPFISIWSCEECYEKSNAKSLEEYNFDQEIESISKNKRVIRKVERVYNKIGHTHWCQECIKEIQLKDHRKRKVELPFKPYENTLIYKDKKIIQNLEDKLLLNFRFKTIHIENLGLSFPALHIKHGTISSPLTITIYEVINSQDQKTILSMISEFFENISKKQRIVQFREKFNWVTEMNGNSSNSYRGEEKILFEEIVE